MSTIEQELEGEESKAEEEEVKRSPKRSVKFEEDKLISAIYEPPEPWATVECLNSYELTAAYKLRCDIDGVEPLYTVLAQLQHIDMKSSRHRYRCFNLKGIQLSGAQIEILEEIFRHVQFEHLNLENTNLDDDTLSALCDMIEFYDSCTELSLARNPRVGNRGWSALTHLLRKLPYLKWIDLRDVLLDECDFSRICNGIRSHALLVHEDPDDPPPPPSNPQPTLGLVGLHLGHAISKIGDLSPLVRSIRWSSICDLRIPDNHIGPSGAAQLVPLLRYYATLHFLDLSRNHLGDEGCSLISKALASTAFSSRAIKSGRCGLFRLNLSDNQLTEASMSALGDALSKSPLLTCLDLSDNPQLGCLGVHRLRPGLLQSHRLKRLNMATCNIQCTGCVSLAEVLLDRPRCLKWLDLTGNPIQTGGLLALCRCLVGLDGPLQIKGLESCSEDEFYQQTLQRLRLLLEQNASEFPVGACSGASRYSETECLSETGAADPRYFWGDSSDEGEEEEVVPDQLNPEDRTDSQGGGSSPTSLFHDD